jgi:hypothetical protein
MPIEFRKIDKCEPRQSFTQQPLNPIFCTDVDKQPESVIFDSTFLNGISIAKNKTF